MTTTTAKRIARTFAIRSMHLSPNCHANGRRARMRHHMLVSHDRPMWRTRRNWIVLSNRRKNVQRANSNVIGNLAERTLSSILIQFYGLANFTNACYYWFYHISRTMFGTLRSCLTYVCMHASLYAIVAQGPNPNLSHTFILLIGISPVGLYVTAICFWYYDMLVEISSGWSMRAHYTHRRPLPH